MLSGSRAKTATITITKLDALTKAQKFPESEKALTWYSDVSGSDNSNELTDVMLLALSLHKVEL